MATINRDQLLSELSDKSTIWDIVVIGGGATGLGSALDAAARGYKTLLLEQADFAKGTSSRSTKLVHGGVRYLAQGNISLVKEALHERGLLLKNAPHLVKIQAFVIPVYNWVSAAFYTIGLKIYDRLAGELSFGKAQFINKPKVLERMPGIRQKGLKGGIVYYDGQFDDARLAVNLAQTAREKGATILNYCKVTCLIKTDEKISGMMVKDAETGKIYILQCRVVLNATGVFVDDILQMDKRDNQHLVRPSQGVHLVLGKSFMPSADALMIPKTEDGRVLFAVPWHDKLLIGTTDTPIDTHSLEPVALYQEIEFILRTAGKYLIKQPTRADVLSVFAGLRPLAAPQGGSSKTKEISRSHKIIVSKSGLVTVIGGKWTTYRKMAEDAVDEAVKACGLDKAVCLTKELAVHGAEETADWRDILSVYGSDRAALMKLIDENPVWGNKLIEDERYIQAQVVFAARHEMALTVEDVLARRLRILFLDARAAIRMAPLTAKLLATALGRDEKWEKDQVRDFMELAAKYILDWQ
jgi:glycerol-3-phosphate dehydrogenase